MADNIDVSLELSYDDDDNSVSVMCGTYFLVTFNADGTFTRHSGFPESLGFDLDESGRIKIESN